MPATPGRNPQTGSSGEACSGAEISVRSHGIIGPSETWTVDQLMDQLITGYAWPGAGGAGPVQVTYSFPTSAATYGADYAPGSQSELGGFSPLSPAQIEAAVSALELWADVANIEFVEVEGNADIRFANTTTAIDFAHAYLPAYGYGGDVWLNPTQYGNQQLGLGDYGRLTLIHEVGHAVGLDHANSYNGSTNQDNPTHNFNSQQYTLMSYYQHQDNPGLFPSAPLVMDILAIQQIYGANYNTRSGDETYGFNVAGDVGAAFDFALNQQPIVAIWDGGGSDTLDLSGYAMDQQITLVAGAFSSVGGLANNLAIAYGAAIENAVGGGGNDAMVGNDLANSLAGGGGSDVLSGGAGDDVLSGGDGGDQLTGGSGNDTYVFAGSFGQDVVADQGGTTTLEFTDLGRDDVSFAQEGADLVISALDGSSSVRVRDYYVDEDSYGLRFAGDAPLDPGLDDNDTFATATDLGRVTAATGASLQDSVGGADPRDLFHFEIAESQEILITLQGAEGDVDLFLYDAAGNPLGQSVAGGTSPDWLQGAIAPGSYFIEVRPYGAAETAYTLGIEGAQVSSGGARGAQVVGGVQGEPGCAGRPPESLALRDLVGLPAAAANDAGFGARREHGFGEALLAA